MTQHTSDFVLIHGLDWQEIPGFAAILQPLADQAQVHEWINTNDLPALSLFCETAGIVEPDGLILAAKLLNTGEADNPLRFYIVR